MRPINNAEFVARDDRARMQCVAGNHAKALAIRGGQNPPRPVTEILVRKRKKCGLGSCLKGALARVMRSSAGASSFPPGTYARAVRGASAATCSQRAATNDTALPAAGAKRRIGALPEPAGSKLRGVASLAVATALQNIMAKDDTAMPDACAREQPATGQATESVDPALEVLNSEKLETALVDLLGQLLIGCPDYPAVRIRPRLFPKLRIGHLEALCNAVDTVWQTRNAELPTESRLRPKAIAWLAAAALGDSFLTREQSEKLGKCIQVELGQLRLKLKKELKSVREHKRFAAKDPEHSEELPWFLKAIDASTAPGFPL